MIILAPLINLWKVASRSPLELIVLQIPHHCDGNDVCNITSPPPFFPGCRPTHRVVFEPTPGQAEGTLTNARKTKKKTWKNTWCYTTEKTNMEMMKNEDLHEVSPFPGFIFRFHLCFRGKNCWETTISAPLLISKALRICLYLSFFSHVQDFVHSLYETVWVV